MAIANFHDQPCQAAKITRRVFLCAGVGGVATLIGPVRLLAVDLQARTVASSSTKSSGPPTNLAPDVELANWNLTLPVNDKGIVSGAADARVVTNAELLAGFELAPYFEVLTDGTLSFRAPVNGATTSGTNYARSELRENLSGENYNWSMAQGGELHATCKVTELPKKAGGGKGSIVIGQIHGGSDQLCRLYYDAGSVYYINDKAGSGKPVETRRNLRDAWNRSPNIPLNAYFSYSIMLEGSSGILTVNVIYDDVTYTFSEVASEFWAHATFYYKAGCYLGVGKMGSEAGTQGSGHGTVVSSHLSTPRHDNPIITDPTFADPTQWVIAGSGKGTTVVSGGSLKVASNSSSWGVRMKHGDQRWPAGNYRMTTKIKDWEEGSYSPVGHPTDVENIINSGNTTMGTSSMSGNGTHVFEFTLNRPLYLGIRGRSGACTMRVTDLVLEFLS